MRSEPTAISTTVATTRHYTSPRAQVLRPSYRLRSLLHSTRVAGGSYTVKSRTVARCSERPLLVSAEAAHMTAAPARPFLQREQYVAPEWTKSLQVIPKERYVLGVLPTPVHRWNVPGVPEGCELWIKQDSLTGLELSGNKIRKLEFLLAEAVARGADCIVTLGGIQSNHARATAVAATMLGLECHLILRNSRTLADSDPGLVGNLLLERMAGAHVYQVTKEEYARVGQAGLAALLESQLTEQGRRPYVVPVGGSSPLGTWGYVDAVAELHAQFGGDKDFFTDITMACGSGATSGGIALACHLSGSKTRVTAYGVCDSPDYFYNYMDSLFDGLGATQEAVGARSRDMVRVVSAKGAGYAISQAEELQTVANVAAATGILLDPVYTGKALNGLLKDMASDPAAWAGRRVLFVHTGGLYGMYDKLGQLQPLVEAQGRSHRLQVPQDQAPKDGVQPGGAMV